MTNRSVRSLAARWLRPSRAGALAALTPALLLSAGTASAQGWLADRSVAEGAGIRTGDLELHPGVGAEVGYDSNWFLRTHREGADLVNGAPANPPVGAAVFRLTPSFYVSTLGTQRASDGGVARLEPRRISFRGGASATGRFFLGSEELSRQYNVGVASDARLDVNQGRPLGFGIFAGYNRLVQPQVLEDPRLSFDRSDLRAGAEIVALPGGGALDLRGAYQFHGALFEQSQGVPYTNLTHEVTVKDRWRFRPRTALFSETSLRFISYPNAERASNYLNGSTPLRARLGLTGLVTDRFGVLVAAGYGATFFKDPAASSSRQYDSINGQVEGTFHLSPGGGAGEPGQATLLLSTVSLGFVRDFQNSLLGNYYDTNKVYARAEYWFGGKTVVRLNAYGEQLSYPPIYHNLGPGAAPSQVTTEFSNYRVGGGLFAEYRLSSSFGLNATIDYVEQISDTRVPVSAGPGLAPLAFDLSYRRLQAFAGARYFF